MLKREINCLIVHGGTLYTRKFYKRALIVETYESTLPVKKILEKKTNKQQQKKLGPSVVFYVRLGLLK